MINIVFNSSTHTIHTRQFYNQIKSNQLPIIPQLLSIYATNCLLSLNKNTESNLTPPKKEATTTPRYLIRFSVRRIQRNKSMAESVELPSRLAILPFRNKVLLPGAIIRIRCTSPTRYFQPTEHCLFLLVTVNLECIHFTIDSKSQNQLREKVTLTSSFLVS